MRQPLLDTVLHTYLGEELRKLLRDAAAVEALSEACAATLPKFEGMSDWRLEGGVFYVNERFGLDPRFLLITREAAPFLQGVVLYTFPAWRKKGYGSAVLQLILDILSSAELTIPFQVPVLAADHPRLQHFYEQLGFLSAGQPTVDTSGDAFFDYFWCRDPFRVFIDAEGGPAIEILR